MSMHLECAEGAGIHDLRRYAVTQAQLGDAIRSQLDDLRAEVCADMRKP